METPRSIRLDSVTVSERVDKYVAERLPELSRTAVQRLIEAGNLTVNGAATSASYRLRAHDTIEVSIPPPEETDLHPEPMDLAVLYEDADILVIDKPAGLVVHPGAGHRGGTLVNGILAHCPDLQGVGGERRPGIVHRLDKDTSGVIVVAKHDVALRSLQRQFKRRTVEKHYVALVKGWLSQPDGYIEAPIGRDRRHRRRMAVRGDGKLARTQWHVLGRYQDRLGRPYTLLDVRLLTGRTHQIRVHFSWLGYPLAGDEVYSRRSTDPAVQRQFLHAASLTFKHPVSGETLTFVAPLPDDLDLALVDLTLVTD
jgi:23S rRNA pseudouridine1911/1915/1917 synthase